MNETNAKWPRPAGVPGEQLSAAEVRDEALRMRAVGQSDRVTPPKVVQRINEFTKTGPVRMELDLLAGEVRRATELVHRLEALVGPVLLPETEPDMRDATVKVELPVVGLAKDVAAYRREVAHLADSLEVLAGRVAI